MKNCNFKLLASNKVGNVLYCCECKDLIIGIGTFILKFKNDQSHLFLKSLQASHREYTQLKNRHSNKIFLKTPVSNLMLALNEVELEQSIDLIEFAFLKMEINELITV